MTGMLTYAVESLSQVIHEAQRLWRQHWLETEGYRDIQGYNPDFSQFLRLDEVGWFRQYTARDEKGELVGHLGFIVHKSRHTSLPSAVEDYFYLVPEARQGMNALKLLRFAVADLKQQGVCEIGMSSKLSNDIKPLLKRAGFKHVTEFFMMNVEQNLPDTGA
jgi:L-amino acid N-acyltransferase YncA